MVRKFTEKTITHTFRLCTGFQEENMTFSHQNAGQKTPKKQEKHDKKKVQKGKHAAFISFLHNDPL